VIGLITGCLLDVVSALGDVFILVYNFHVPLALKVGCPFIFGFYLPVCWSDGSL
jgi:hypothetical protein